MEAAEARRLERALRRAERAKIAEQEQRQAICTVLEHIGAFLLFCGFMWVACYWAAI